MQRVERKINFSWKKTSGYMSPVSLPPNFFVVAQLFHLPSSASLWPPRQLKHLYTFLTPFQDSLFEPSALLFPLSVFSPRISAKWHTKEKREKKIMTLLIKTYHHLPIWSLPQLYPGDLLQRLYTRLTKSSSLFGFLQIFCQDFPKIKIDN